jgi:hypothetical protein
MEWIKEKIICFSLFPVFLPVGYWAGFVVGRTKGVTRVGKTRRETDAR